MLDIGWSELLLIGVVALIVVGPRDLPVMFRTLGRFTAKARSMAREFQKAMDDAAKTAGVHETLKDVRDMTSKKSLGLEALENAATKFEKWKPALPAAKPAASSPAPKLASATRTKADAAPATAQELQAAPAADPQAEKPLPGPATRALAEKVAREREARRAPKPAKPATAEAAPASGAGKSSSAKPKPTRSPKTPETVVAEAGSKPDKPRKPRTKKLDA